MTVLVVGGAGYIGSHMVKMLHQQGHDVVTLDNLSAGYRDAVKYGEFIDGDIADTDLLDRIFEGFQFECVMHFASHIEVGESVKNPAKYFRNNVTNTLNLLDAMIRHQVLNFIFSSSAAIFGEPDYVPVDEAHAKKPINAYGKSKLMVEQVLEDYENAYGLKSICLRYFNAAGADPEGELGERHCPETHLIPLVLQAASGRRDAITVFGQDYPTHDGTCVRDYVHVADLCSAHLLGLDYLMRGGGSSCYNIGNGRGFSVREVLDVAAQVTGMSISIQYAEKRAGDPATLVADSSSIKQDLGWEPRFSGLAQIIEHAWKWEISHFNLQP